MKKFVIGGFLLLLTACSSTSTPPTGSGNNQPPVLNYPYNPNFNAVESSDTRVPYYGEWVWAATLSSGTTYTGKMSISRRAPADAEFKNTGAGAAVWCVTTPCIYNKDIGLIGSFSSGNVAKLSVGFYDGDFNQLKFVALDADGIVGTEFEGKPTLSGAGAWYFYNGSTATMGFAMAQVSTVPPIKLQGPATVPQARLGQITTAALAAQSEQQALQARALAVLKLSFK
ncbi:hypothetical protein [Deinococcus sp.]|uniref:hypothetical protein n=1 Tax=Deinococcus sp. TaxID=47478 RepID=UPI0025FC6C40|nr:hypothetical protein [Deinococcus sp.]